MEHSVRQLVRLDGGWFTIERSSTGAASTISGGNSRMKGLQWAPRGIDLERPSVARVYDYFLGGSRNFEVDRQLAEAIVGIAPAFADTMRANRAFVRRAVRFLAEAGITQFLDVGSGIPTVGNVHEVARRVESTSRVVYVDIDPIAVWHSQVLLTGDPGIAVIQADARNAESILADPATRQVLDLDQPVAVLLAGVLSYLPDEAGPAGVVARLRDALRPGSYLVLLGATYEDQPAEVIEAHKLLGRTGTPIHLRSRSDLLALFDGLEL